MQFWKTTFRAVTVVVWSVLLTGHLQASLEEKRIFRSNSVLDLDKPYERQSRESRAADQEPINIDHRSRTKRTAATAAEQAEILRVHNSWRQKEGASDMYYLRWNNLLTRMAEIWATGCNFVHGQPNTNTSSLGYDKIGQNLYASARVPLNLTSVIQSWYNEKLNYNYKNNSCLPGKGCIHYRQVIWSTNYEIGCGYTVCPVVRPINLLNAVYVVCYYGPGSNDNRKKPYQLGAACSNCSSGQYYCNKGLCDKTCVTSGPNCACSAACQHCGNVTSTCRCKCTVGWTGDDCSKECKNYDARCGPNSAWLCSMHAPVYELCPLLCGKCVAGTPPPCVKTIHG